MSQLSKIIAFSLVIIALLLTTLALYLLVKPSSPSSTSPAAAPLPLAEAVKPQPTPLFDVVIAKEPLKAGSVLKPDNLTLAQWPIQPEQAFSHPKELTDRFLRVDLEKGELIQNNMLMKGLAHHLEPGERALSVSLATPFTQASRIEAGDWVDVFVFLKKQMNEVDLSQARLLLAKKRVLALGTQSVDGPVPESNRPNQDIHNTAVLAIPLEEVNTLLLAAREGAIHLVARSPFDEGLPTPELFPAFKPILTGKPTLSTDQRQELDQPENKAFAGDSLIELSSSSNHNPPPLSPPTPSLRETSVSVPRTDKSRTIEIIRGPTLQLEHY